MSIFNINSELIGLFIKSRICLYRVLFILSSVETQLNSEINVTV